MGNSLIPWRVAELVGAMVLFSAEAPLSLQYLSCFAAPAALRSLLLPPRRSDTRRGHFNSRTNRCPEHETGTELSH